MELHDKFTCYINLPSGSRRFYPANGSLAFHWEREDDGHIFHRHKCTTQLKFVDDQKRSHPDFTDMYKVEQDLNDRCRDADITMDINCQGADSQFWQGKIAMVDGEWSVWNCNVGMKTRVNDKYTCFLRNWEKKVNILQFTDKQTARLFQGVVQYKDCFEIYQGGPTRWSATGTISALPTANDQGQCINPAEGWTVVENKGDFIDGSQSQNTQGGTWNVRTKYAREFLSADQTPKGVGWVSVAGGYARIVPVDLIDAQNIYGHFEETYVIPVPEGGFDNGVYLEDALNKMLEEIDCDLNVISNFFGINPDGTAPDNEVYQAAEDFLHELMIFQKTDVTNYKATENATKNELTFKEVFEDFREMFNVYWDIDDNGNLRIEHYTYFAFERRLNLLEPKFEDFIFPQWVYTYETDKLPESETWSWPETQSPTFNGDPITYSGACVTDDPNSKDKKHAIRTFMTDIALMILKPDTFGKDGSVLVTTAGGYILSELVSLTQESEFNGHLSIPNLQDHYHRYNRPQWNGTMNRQLQKFESIQRLRKQTVKVPFSCCNILLFKPGDLVKTQLGWGEVRTADWEWPKQELTLELLHD